MPSVMPEQSITFAPPSTARQWHTAPHDVLVPAPGRVVVLGSYGDFGEAGTYVAALDHDGTIPWDHAMPHGELVASPIGLQPAPDDGLWSVRTTSASTLVHRYDLDGSIPIDVALDGLTTVRIGPTPDGGLVLDGFASRDPNSPELAQLDAAGTVVWRGPDNLANFDRAEADGEVIRIDAAGQTVWQFDPRPPAFERFPEHRGAHFARLRSDGFVFAVGTVIAAGGRAQQISLIDPDGIDIATTTARHLTHSRARVHADDWLTVDGIATECERRRWVAVFDPQGVERWQVTLDERHHDAPVTLDAQRRVVAIEGNEFLGLEAHWYAEVGR